MSSPHQGQVLNTPPDLPGNQLLQNPDYCSPGDSFFIKRQTGPDVWHYKHALKTDSLEAIGPESTGRVLVRSASGEESAANVARLVRVSVILGRESVWDGVRSHWFEPIAISFNEDWKVHSLRGLFMAPLKNLPWWREGVSRNSLHRIQESSSPDSLGYDPDAEPSIEGEATPDLVPAGMSSRPPEQNGATQTDGGYNAEDQDTTAAETLSETIDGYME